MSESRTLILTCALAFPGDGLTLFVRSARQSGYAGRIVILVAQRGDEDKAMLRDLGVELLPFQLANLPPRSRYTLDLALLLSSPRNFRRKRQVLAPSWIPMLSSRFLQYRFLLEDWASDCDNIILADARDCIFQGNPATLPFGERMSIVSEVGTKTVGNCPWNSEMIRKNFGSSVLRAMSEEPVFCCGLLFGKRQAALNYLQRVGDALVERASTEYFDQPTTNFLAFRDPSFLDKIAATNPYVLHMNSMVAGEFSLRDDGVILNQAGQVPTIVHQYDRHPEVFESVRRRILSK